MQLKKKPVKKLMAYILTAMMLLTLIPVIPAYAVEGGTYVSGPITANTEWTAGTYRLEDASGTLTVAEGATLTIDAGVTVVLGAASYTNEETHTLATTLAVNGSLIVNGTSAQPVVFTSNSPNAASMTGNDCWSTITVKSGGNASFSYATFDRGGNNAGTNASVQAESGAKSLSFSHCTFQNVCTGKGAVDFASYTNVNDVTPNLGIDHCTFTGSMAFAVQASGGNYDDTATASVTNNSFTGITGTALQLGPFKTAVVTGNTFNAAGSNDTAVKFEGAAIDDINHHALTQSITFSGNTFNGGGSLAQYPVSAPGSSFIDADADGTTTTSGYAAGYERFALRGGDCAGSACTLGKTGLDYLLAPQAKVYVTSGAALTVKPGVTVRFATTAQASDTPQIVVNAGGTFNPQGTATGPITFRTDADITNVTAFPAHSATGRSGVILYSQPSGSINVSYCDFTGLRDAIYVQYTNSLTAVNVANCAFAGCGNESSAVGALTFEQAGSGAGTDIGIQNCTITDSVYSGIYHVMKSGVTSGSAKLTVSDCVIRGSGAGTGGEIDENAISIVGGKFAADGVKVERTLLSGNADNGLYYGPSAPAVSCVNDTVTANGKNGIMTDYSGACTVKNSILYGNNTGSGSYYDLEAVLPSAVTYSCVGTKSSANNLGTGCLTLGTDPKFNNASNGDYTLASDSPCKAAGEDGVDMGYIPGTGGSATVAGSLQVTMGTPSTAILPLQKGIKHTFTVTNSGSAVLNVQVGASDPEDVNVTLMQQFLYLGAGESQQVEMVIEPTTTAAGSYNKTITYTFTNRGNANDTKTQDCTYSYTVLDTASLAGPVSFAGTLTAANGGAAVGGANVQVYTRVDGQPLKAATTDSGGAFSISDLPSGIDYYLKITAPNYLDTYRFYPAASGAVSGIGVSLVASNSISTPSGYTLSKTDTGSIGYWKYAVDSSGTKLLAVNGMENWPTTWNHTGDDPNLTLKQQSKLTLYPLDGTFTPLWSYALGNEAWGADLSADGTKAAAAVMKYTTDSGSTVHTGKIVVLNGANGNVLWSKDIYNNSGSTSLYDAVASGNSHRDELRIDCDAREVQFSHDGTKLAVGTQNGFFFVLDTSNGNVLWYGFLNGQVRKIAFDATDANLYAGSGDGYLYKFAVSGSGDRTGGQAWKSYIHSWPYTYGLKLSPDGGKIAVGVKSGELTVLNTSNGNKLWDYDMGILCVRWVDFSSDGSLLAAGSGAPSGTTVFSASAGTPVSRSFFSASGMFTANNLLFEGEGTGKFFDPLSGTLLNPSGTDSTQGSMNPGFSGNAATYWKIAYVTPNGNYAVLASRDIGSGDTGGIAFFTADTPQPHQVTVTFIDGGSTYATKTTAQGTSLGNAFPSTPTKSGYTFGGWFTGTDGSGTQFTSATAVSASISVYAKWTSNGNEGNTGGGSGGGGGSAVNSQQATVTGSDGASSNLNISMNGTDAKAQINATQSKLLTVGGTLKIDIPTVPDATGYGVELPAGSLSAAESGGTLTMSTALGKISIPADMLSSVSGASDKTAQITVGKGSTASLSSDIQAKIGDRPVLQLTLSLGGTQTEWSNPSAPVTVSIPYTPTAEELKHPESIVVWYIDGSGNVVCIPSGHYDAATGMVAFATTHFSQYAVSYNSIGFADVSGSAWYKDYVSYLAARNIVGGTGGGQFSPDATITRAQFVTILARMSGDDLSGYKSSAFTDVSAGDWYFAAVQWANASGVAVGADGKFSPDAGITREQMAVMLYRYAKHMGTDVSNVEGMSIREFTDYGSISSYALLPIQWAINNGIVSGDNGSFAPQSSATRAQAAKMISVLLQNFSK